MKKLTMLLISVFSLLTLSSCGGTETAVGTWYLEEDTAIVVVLEEGGRALIHDYDYDETLVASWTGTDGAYTMSFDGESIDMTARGEDTLVMEDGTLVRGEDTEVPLITYNTLYDYSWYTEDGGELCFYSDESWNICDNVTLDWFMLDSLYQTWMENLDIEEVYYTMNGGQDLTVVQLYPVDTFPASVPYMGSPFYYAHSDIIGEEDPSMQGDPGDTPLYAATEGTWYLNGDPDSTQLHMGNDAGQVYQLQ